MEGLSDKEMMELLNKKETGLSDEDMLKMINGDNAKGLSDKELLELLNQSEKKETDWTEDIEIGLKDLGHSAATAGQMVAGGITSRLGATDTSDRIFGAMDKRRQAWEEEKKGYDQGLSGQVISGLIGVVPMIASSYVVGPVAAAGAFAGMGALDSGAKNIENGADTPSAINQAIIEGDIDTAAMAFPIGRGAIKGAMWGAGGNVIGQGAKDIVGQGQFGGTKAEEQYQMTGDKYVVAGATGALPGGVFGGLS